jgi:hypothetical protein
MRTTRATLTIVVTVAMMAASSESASAEWRIERDGGFNGAIHLSVAPDGSRVYVVSETDIDPQGRDYLTLGLDVRPALPSGTHETGNSGPTTNQPV